MAEETKLTLPDYIVNDDFILSLSQYLSYFTWLGLPWKITRGQKLWSDMVLLGLVVSTYYGFKRVFLPTLSFERVFIRTIGAVKYMHSFVAIFLIRRMRSKWFLLSKSWTTGNHTLPEMGASNTSFRKNMFWTLLALIILATIDRLFLLWISLKIKPYSSMHELLDDYAAWARTFIVTSSWYAPYISTLMVVLVLCGPAVACVQDFIILAFSMALVARQNRLNTALRSICERHSDDKEKMYTINADNGSYTINNNIVVWRKIREAFVRHSRLVATIDNIIGPLILLSVFTNLTYILMYTVFGFNTADMGNLTSQGYYAYAAIRISLTCFIVLLKSSEVHNSSTAALMYLRKCNMNSYSNIEVRRLYFQLSKNEVALSGMGFFRLKRIFILRALSVIITYDLMLLQYNDRLTSGAPWATISETLMLIGKTLHHNSKPVTFAIDTARGKEGKKNKKKLT